MKFIQVEFLRIVKAELGCPTENVCEYVYVSECIGKSTVCACPTENMLTELFLEDT